jgi:uncharacterized peroxidase-related enzyme
MYDLIDPETATGSMRALLDATRRQLGRVPNLYRAMANSPKTLTAYLAFRAALQGGALDTGMCERIALLTAQLNACDYCVAAHSFRAQKIGLSAQEINGTRLARSDSPKIHAALAFVVELIGSHGAVRAATTDTLTRHGWSEEEIGEIVGHVALNVFSNYFKQVAEPELDFPPAPDLVG